MIVETESGVVEIHNGVRDENETSQNGLGLYRYPQAVRNAMSPLGQVVSQDSAGCEIRFVTESPNFKLYLSSEESVLRPYEIQHMQVCVFKGSLFHSMHHLEAGKMNMIAVHDIDGAKKALFESTQSEIWDSEYFSNHVWRVFLGRTPFRFHRLDTYAFPVRKPEANEIPKKKWLAYGSSITHGACPTAHHLSYVYIAARKLGIDVMNKGLSGSCMCEKTVVDFLLDDCDWDLITLEIGVNMRASYTAEEFRDRANYLIESAIAKHPTKPIFLISIYPNSATNGIARDNNSLAATREMEYRDILQEIAANNKDSNLVYIEGKDILTDPLGLTTDLIHPSDYGFMEMGANLAKKMKPYL